MVVKGIDPPSRMSKHLLLGHAARVGGVLWDAALRQVCLPPLPPVQRGPLSPAAGAGPLPQTRAPSPAPVGRLG